MLKVKLLDIGPPKAVLRLALQPPDSDDIERTVLLLKQVRMTRRRDCHSLSRFHSQKFKISPFGRQSCTSTVLVTPNLVRILIRNKFVSKITRINIAPLKLFLWIPPRYTPLYTMDSWFCVRETRAHWHNLFLNMETQVCLFGVCICKWFIHTPLQACCCCKC